MSEPLPAPRAGEPFNPYGMPEYRRAVRGCRWIRPAEYRLWDALVDRGGKDGVRFPNLETLASDAGISRSHAQTVARRLQKLGLIARRERFEESGRQTSNEYHCTFVPVELLKAPQPHVAEGGGTESSGDPEISGGTESNAGEGIQSNAHGGTESNAPGMYPYECIPSERNYPREETERNSQQRSVPHARKDQSSALAELIRAISEYFGDTTIAGKKADAAIIARTATALGDIRALPTFREKVQDWTRANAPTSWGIMPLMAADAHELWQQGIARTANNTEQGGGEAAYGRLLRESLVRGKAEYDNLPASTAPIGGTSKQKDTWVPGLRRADVDSALASLLGESLTH